MDVFVVSKISNIFALVKGGCSVVAARKTSDLDSAYLQCAGAGSIPVTRSIHGYSVTAAHRLPVPDSRLPIRRRWFDSAYPCFFAGIV